MMHTVFVLRAALAAAALAALPAPVQAQPATTPPAKAAAKDAAPAVAAVAANQFPANSGPLALNGWGTRKRFGFEVYYIGMYAQTKSANADDHLSLARPSRLVIRFARELENEQFTRILLAAMRERVNMKETPTVVDSMLKFSEVFSSVPVFKINDEVILSISPGGKMEFSINGDSKNFKPIFEVPLARGLLSIFIGANPIDADLKIGLLEGGPKLVDKPKTAPGQRR